MVPMGNSNVYSQWKGCHDMEKETTFVLIKMNICLNLRITIIVLEMFLASLQIMKNQLR